MKETSVLLEIHFNWPQRCLEFQKRWFNPLWEFGTFLRWGTRWRYLKFAGFQRRGLDSWTRPQRSVCIIITWFHSHSRSHIWRPRERSLTKQGPSVLQLVISLANSLGIEAVFLKRRVCVCSDLKLAPFPLVFKKKVCFPAGALRGLAECAWVLKFSIKRGTFCPLDYPTPCKSTHTACFIATTNPERKSNMLCEIQRPHPPPPPLLQPRQRLLQYSSPAKVVTQGKDSKGLANGATVAFTSSNGHRSQQGRGTSLDWVHRSRVPVHSGTNTSSRLEGESKKAGGMRLQPRDWCVYGPQLVKRLDGSLLRRPHVDREADMNESGG